jgi:hypothetical protein
MSHREQIYAIPTKPRPGQRAIILPLAYNTGLQERLAKAASGRCREVLRKPARYTSEQFEERSGQRNSTPAKASREQTAAAPASHSSVSKEYQKCRLGGQ